MLVGDLHSVSCYQWNLNRAEQHALSPYHDPQRCFRALFTFTFLNLCSTFPFPSSPQTSQLALSAVWYWRIMLRHTTRTSHQLSLTSSSRNVSITLVTPHRSSVPPLVSYFLFIFWLLLLSVFPEMMQNNHLIASEGFCIHTVWSGATAKAIAHCPVNYKSLSENCSLSWFSRHPNHYYRLKGRATNMAWAAAPALQFAQLGGLQHLWGLHLIFSANILLFMLFFISLTRLIFLDNVKGLICSHSQCANRGARRLYSS